MLLLFIKINYRAINDDQFIKINNSVQDHIKKFENEGKQKIIKLILPTVINLSKIINAMFI